MSSKIRKDKSVTLGISKAKEKKTPFLLVEIPIWDKLSPYALKMYGQLRKLVDFTQEHDQAEITVERLAILSDMSVRKAYQVLNELEKEHFLIQRLNFSHYRYGQTNSYDIAQAYNYFKPTENMSELLDISQLDQSFTTPAYYAVTTALNAVETAQNAVPYIEHHSFQHSSHVCGELDNSTAHTVKNLKKEKSEARCLQDEAIRTLFSEKFSDRDISIEQLFSDCQEHYEQKSLWATKDKFSKWVKREDPNNYKKIQNNKNSEGKKVKDMIMADYNEYVAKFKNDRDNLRLERAQGKEPLTFEAWSDKNANTTRMQERAV